MKPLTATLRLQFHRDFTLDDATALVDYFAALASAICTPRRC
nr:hypothetical protein [Pseudomonas phenolilytica]